MSLKKLNTTCRPGQPGNLKMKTILAVLVLILNSFGAVSQKPVIDDQAIKDWPSVDNPGISPNGKYVFFTIRNVPVGHTTLIIKAAEGNWSRSIADASGMEFSNDNRCLLFTKGKDSLCILRPGSDSMRIISGAGAFQFSGRSTIVYKNSPMNMLTIENFITGAKQSFKNVKDYRLIRESNTLAVYTSYKNNREFRTVDLDDFSEKPIWTSNDTATIERYQFNKGGKQVALVIRQKAGGKFQNQLWYYRTGMTGAVELAHPGSLGFDTSFTIGKFLPMFSKNGNWVFFYGQKNEPDVKVADLPAVDVWSYRDKMVQSEQLNGMDPDKVLFAVDCQGDSVERLENKNEMATPAGLEDFVIITGNYFGPSFYAEAWHNNNAPQTYSLFNLLTGKKVFLTSSKDPDLIYTRNERIIFFDRKVKAYFCYNIKDGRKWNITTGIPGGLIFQLSDINDRRLPNEVGTAGLLNGDSSILVYDNYDVWKVNFITRQKPICLTGRFGFRNHIKFRLVYEGEDQRRPGKLLLSAFNTSTKQNGFYLCSADKDMAPTRLVMEDVSYYRVQRTDINVELTLDYPFRPVKARDADVFIVRKMTSEKSPNYFLTEDFRKFAPISQVYPEAQYNWLTATLMSFQTGGGRLEKGILYKPENFEPKKKYPLILYYYEEMSDRLHDYAKPDLMKGDLNIPWFVSRGYLVFTPDITYTIGRPGKSARDCIVSAAKYLAGLPYVDGKKMGLQGHSFGGFETNYTVTHSKMFAAAVAGAGPTDFVSGYGSLQGLGTQQDMFETGQLRIQRTLWERPDLYFENSPVLKANTVTTPLLMMHNKEDGNVPWQQGIELFTALRRLGKRVWLLQYDGERHVFYGDSKADLDYTIRVTQFFNHYLKGAPAPVWMTQGIPGRLKGFVTGYDLDL